MSYLSSSSDTSQALQPVNKSERMEILDILRGFAILGIFMANLHHMTAFGFLPADEKLLVPGAAMNGAGLFFLNMFVDGKFYSLFSLLFGVGFAILYMRAKEKGKSFVPLFISRIGWLLVIGLFHSFIIWAGDILAVYAFTAVLLIPFRNANNKILLTAAVFLLLSPILIYGYMWMTDTRFGSFLFAIAIKLSANTLPPHLAITQGGLIDVMEFNLMGTFFRYADLFLTSRFPKILGMFLLGYYFGRNNYFADLQAHRQLFRKLLIYLGIPGLIFSGAMAYMYTQGYDYMPLGRQGMLFTITYAFGVHALSLAYMAAIVLMYLSLRTQNYLQWLAPAGRMALTLYIMQSLIGIFVFYNIGLGLGPVGPLYWIPFAILVFVLQVQFSHWWFRYFKFGPLEWMWRSLMYRKLQQFKVAASPAVGT